MFVKKLWSMEPKEYKKLTLKNAGEQYLEYIASHFEPQYMYGPERIEKVVEGKFRELDIKTFKEWLETEI